MNLFTRTLFTIASVLAVITVLSLPAFAIRDDVTVSSIRRDNRSSIVKIEGNLICTMNGQNNGQACDLKIKENKTGRIYSINQNRDLMRLFFNGVKNVAIEGTIENLLGGNQNLTVAKATAL